jgi:predicted nucleic acid-binding protein
MIVVVNDANILIDMIKLQLLDPFFRLDWTFYTTDLIIDNELYDDQQSALAPFIQRGKLIIQQLDIADLLAISQMMAQKSPLSDKDCSALRCAQTLKATLLTSDKVLREYASKQSIDVHGHLWIFDAMVSNACITPATAIHKLRELDSINPKLKLPKHACDEYINTWSRNVE